MNKLTKQIFFSYLIFFLGCSTAVRSNSEVSFMDRKEAKKIAIEELLRLKMGDQVNKNRSVIYDSSVVSWSNTKIDSDIYMHNIFDDTGQSRFKDAWIILFKPRLMSFSTGFLVVVDKKSGAIKHTHSGNIGEGLAEIFKDKIERDAKYIEEIIKYHKQKQHWPFAISGVMEHVKDVKVNDPDNFIITVKNDQEMLLSNKEIIWSYLITVQDNKYDVRLTIPPEGHTQVPYLLNNILDGIGKEVNENR
jgi:hypothetical protein